MHYSVFVVVISRWLPIETTLEGSTALICFWHIKENISQKSNCRRVHMIYTVQKDRKHLIIISKISNLSSFKKSKNLVGVVGPILITAHNWQKWKSTFLACPCHEIYRVEAVGLKSSSYALKIMIFCENVRFGAILWKFDILSITAWLKFESKNPFAHTMWHI